MGTAAYHSLIVYFGTYVLMAEVPGQEGTVLGLYGTGAAMMSVCIVIVTFQVRATCPVRRGWRLTQGCR
jgi:hypothetical protein